MASTYSTRLRFELPATGEQNGTWGDTTNTNIGTLIEEAIAGAITINIGDANYTLTTTSGGTDEARQAVLNITSALTARRTITIPAEEKVYIIKNGTTGGFAIRVKASGGSDYIDIPMSCTCMLWCNGTEVKAGPNLVTSDFVITDVTDQDKRAQFVVSGVTTGNTRLLTVPDASTTLVGTDTTQTISNKTLGSVLNGGGFKIQGIGDGTAVSHAATVGQLQNGVLQWSGTAFDGSDAADVIRSAFTPAITALVDGQMVRVRSRFANATTTPTFSPDGLANRTIRRYDNTALEVGDIPGANYEMILVYNLAGTKWFLLNPYRNSASTTAQILTGTDTSTRATPDSIAALWEKGTNIASAATITIGEGGYYVVTGTTNIDTITFTQDVAGRKIWLRFNGALVLNGTLSGAANITLPTGASITTAAGDTACIVCEGTGFVRCISYQRASGKALVPWGGYDFIETLTASASADLSSSDLNGLNYASLRLTLSAIRPTTDDVGMRVQFSSDGTTWDTTNYEGRIASGTNGTGAETITNMGGTGDVTRSGGGNGIGNTVNDGTVSGTILISNVSGSRKMGIISDLVYGDPSGGFWSARARGWNTAAFPIRKVRIIMDSGTIAAGTMKVEGMD